MKRKFTMLLALIITILMVLPNYTVKAGNGVDKTELEASINNAKAIDRTLYTDESLAVLDEKLATAETVFADEAATQEQVDNAKLELDNAIAGLVEKPEPEPVPKPVVNKKSLVASINYAKAVNLSLYSKTSAAAVNTALRVAEAVLVDVTATQEQVDSADIALRISINNLKSYKIDLKIKPDLDKVSSRVTVNVLVSFSNLGTEDISELILTDSLGFYRNVGSVKAPEYKIYNLSYIMPAEFQSDSYTLAISAVAKYADGTTNSVSKSVDFQVTDLSADELDQVREPQLAQNVEKDEPVTKHNLELPKTGEHNYYYVSLALILMLGLLMRKRVLLARN